MKCWRCLKPFYPSPTGACLYCGYEQDADHVQYVKFKQIMHDFTDRNPQTDGGSKDYEIKKKW